LHDEVGRGKGLGFNLNVPLPNGTGDKGYEHAMHELVVPAISKFMPEMILLVIGQDSSAVLQLQTICFLLHFQYSICFLILISHHGLLLVLRRYRKSIYYLMHFVKISPQEKLQQKAMDKGYYAYINLI
jgi:hypothetical protein